MKYLFVIFMVFLLLPGCSDVLPEEYHNITIRLFPGPFNRCGNSSTRADSEIGDSDFEDLIEEVFIAMYDRDDRLVTYWHFEEGSSFEFTLSDYECLRVRTVVALCNLHAVELSSDFVLKNGLSTINDLHKISFRLPKGNRKDLRALPMFAIGKVDSNSLESGNLYLELKRVVSKIIFFDELSPEYSIDRIVLSEGNEWGSLLGEASDEAEVGSADKESQLEFSLGDDGSFFLYVVPGVLSSSLDDESRKLTVTVKSNKGASADHILRLAPYENGIPREPREDETAWQSLLPNHRYVFHLSDVETAVEVKDKIVVHWYACVRGHESTTELNEDSKFCSTKLQFINRATYEYFPVKITDLYYDYSHSKVYSDDVWEFFYDIDLSTKSGWDVKNVDYILYSKQSSTRYAEGSIIEDGVRLENKADVTHIWLNEAPIDGKLDGTRDYPTDHPYRIYCRGDELTDCWVSKSGYGGYKPYGNEDMKLQTDGRGYKYLQFNMIEGHPMKWESSNYFEFEIKNSSGRLVNKGLSGTTPYPKVDKFTAAAIFLQTIDGEEYYVFYYN